MLKIKSDRIIIFSVSIIATILIFFIGVMVGLKIPEDGICTTKDQVIYSLEQKLNSKVLKGLVPILNEEDGVTASQLKNNLRGQIETIDGNSVAIKFDNRYNNGSFISYLDEPDYYIKKFQINKDTKIITRQRKDFEITQGEVEEFLILNRSKTAKEKNTLNQEDFVLRENLVLPPTSYIKKEILIKDLKSGAQVTVEAAGGYNIKNNSAVIISKMIVDL